jgi:outer membrane murein-binding lipoprotein Lpp
MNKRSSAGYFFRLAFLLAAVSLAGCAELTGGFSDAGMQELASAQDVREYQTTFGRMRIGLDGAAAKGVYEYRQERCAAASRGTC